MLTYLSQICVWMNGNLFFPHSAGVYAHCNTHSFSNVFPFCVVLFCVNMYSPSSWYQYRIFKMKGMWRKLAWTKYKLWAALVAGGQLDLMVLGIPDNCPRMNTPEIPSTDLSNINHKHMHAGCLTRWVLHFQCICERQAVQQSSKIIFSLQTFAAGIETENSLGSTALRDLISCHSFSCI